MPAAQSGTPFRVFPNLEVTEIDLAVPRRRGGSRSPRPDQLGSRQCAAKAEPSSGGEFCLEAPFRTTCFVVVAVDDRVREWWGFLGRPDTAPRPTPPNSTALAFASPFDSGAAKEAGLSLAFHRELSHNGCASRAGVFLGLTSRRLGNLVSPQGAQSERCGFGNNGGGRIGTETGLEIRPEGGSDEYRRDRSRDRDRADRAASARSGGTAGAGHTRARARAGIAVSDERAPDAIEPVTGVAGVAHVGWGEGQPHALLAD